MSLVGRVGRKRFRARFALLFLYALLSIGAITTLYPFALMVSTGLKGPTDQNDNKLIPAYFTNFDELKDGKLSEDSLVAKYLADKYGGDASAIASTRTGPEIAPAELDLFEEFLRDLPVDYWTAGFKTASGQVTGRLTQAYRHFLQSRYSSVDALNKAYIEENVGFQTVVPPSELLERANWTAPTTLKYREWREFKATLPAEFRIPVRLSRLWQEFLRTKFQNQIASVPSEIVGSASSFESIEANSSHQHYGEFLAALPSRYRRGATEEAWAQWEHLGRKPSVSDPPVASKLIPKALPIEAYELATLRKHQSQIKGEFASRNFAYVVEYIALNGRALWNTAIFCLLAVITHLIVNPIAAYALSRYPLRSSGKILIFLLATMAFPAEVAMIPNFLLLRDLGLLNTFAALVLPTMASGYMIFLLKGFFDSLPQELFEAGQIDGAKEITMMGRIALPLSRPVLGYISLLAFMGAYGAFMYAFLVVQDQRMWTLMVWIYQLQQTAPKAVVMAALTLAAIPTLLVFLFAQRTIMRGIVLPSER